IPVVGRPSFARVAAIETPEPRTAPRPGVFLCFLIWSTPHEHIHPLHFLHLLLAILSVSAQPSSQFATTTQIKQDIDHEYPATRPAQQRVTQPACNSRHHPADTGRAATAPAT